MAVSDARRSWRPLPVLDSCGCRAPITRDGRCACVHTHRNTTLLQFSRAWTMPLFLRSRDAYAYCIYIYTQERWMDGKRDYTIGARISLFMGWEQWAWFILPMNEDASRLSLRWKCFFKLSYLFFCPRCLNDARDSLQTLIAKRIVVYGLVVDRCIYEDPHILTLKYLHIYTLCVRQLYR